MSHAVQNFLVKNGISQSRTTPYHPTGNGQCERYNGVLWKKIQLCLADENKDEAHWESVLPKALHAQRTLLCTTTNSTPHDRLFTFPRRTGYGLSLPSWLLNPGAVMLRRFVRQNKSDPLVDEVELLEANPNFARVKFSDGREDTVSTSDLSPCPRVAPDTAPYSHKSNRSSPECEVDEDKDLRRSTRARKAPDRFF